MYRSLKWKRPQNIKSGISYHPLIGSYSTIKLQQPLGWGAPPLPKQFWEDLRGGYSCSCCYCYHMKVKSTDMFCLGWEFDNIFLNEKNLSTILNLWYCHFFNFWKTKTTWTGALFYLNDHDRQTFKVRHSQNKLDKQTVERLANALLYIFTVTMCNIFLYLNDHDVRSSFICLIQKNI